VVNMLERVSTTERIMKGKVISVNISKEKGEKKTSVGKAWLEENYGLRDDAHAGERDRQVSLLAQESIEKMRAKGLEVKPGDFAENITTEGIDFTGLALGTILAMGKEVLLELTQLGKVCNDPCAIFYQVGECVMPTEGIFARVLRNGWVKVGDQITIVE
jgi:MOSC domain-containing protein YiiM